MVANKLLKENDTGSAVMSREPMPARKSCTGYLVYRILSIIYAVFFFLVGALLLAIGLWVIFVKQDYESIHDALSKPAVLAATVGAIMILTAVIGVVGGATAKLWPLRIFLAIVIIVFIIQVVIGIVAFIYRESTIEHIDHHLNIAIDRYGFNKQITLAVDKVQQKFQCCGLNNLSDWANNQRYSCSGDSNSEYFCRVPDSCCKDKENNKSPGCGRQVTSNAPLTQLKNRDIVYIYGCRWQFLAWLENNLDVVGATALGFAILHILGIFVIYMFITKVEDRYRLFKYRKRYYPS